MKIIQCSDSGKIHIIIFLKPFTISLAVDYRQNLLILRTSASLLLTSLCRRLRWIKPQNKEVLMITIVAGSRSITDYDIIKKAIEASGFHITCIVSGGAKGVDSLGERYAREHGIEIRLFPAEWEDFSSPCIRKYNRHGKAYNALAGPRRNGRMAEYADALIAVHNGSAGTLDMIKQAKSRGLQIFEYRIDPKCR